ncbi:MAG: GFA family protein [Pseudomonadota bacterium]
MEIDGKCFCGFITYRATIDPERIAVCHCTDCQNHSGAAYGVVASVTADFELLTGSMKAFVKIADSGARRVLTFCPECGTRIYAKPEGDEPGFWGLRVGTISQRAALPPRMQVWCDSALGWTADLRALPRFPGNPVLTTAP